MADPAIIDYLKQNLPIFGAAVLRERMLQDGVTAEEFDEALKTLQVPLPTLPPLSLPTPAMPPPVEQMPPPPTLASPPGRSLPPNTAPGLAAETDGPAAPSMPAFSAQPPAPKKKRGLAFLAVMGGGILLIVAGLLSQKKNGANPESGAETSSEEAVPEIEDGVYRGHYGYLFKIPKDYRAWGTFNDPRKTEEVVYIFPKGTNHSHFIHEGLYGSLGILKLEVMPRRVPQGFIGIDTLKAWVTGKLTREKATFTIRELDVNGKPAFIVNSEKPFKYARAYLVGAKVRYGLVGGEENALFVDVLSSLHEASPHDRPGE